MVTKMVDAPRRDRGFTYIGILVAVVILGMLLTAASHVWTQHEQRERESQLLFVGDAYRMAIARYFAYGHQYPVALQSLLSDERSPVPRRYLRQLYADPITGKSDWKLIAAPDGVGIMGVASRSQLVPIKRRGFGLADAAFVDSQCYCSWQFIFLPSPLRAPSTPLSK